MNNKNKHEKTKIIKISKFVIKIVVVVENNKRINSLNDLNFIVSWNSRINKKTKNIKS